MKLLKITVLLFALFSFHSCQQTQETIQPEPIVKIEVIDPSQDDKLLELISGFQSSSSTNGRVKSFDFGDVDFSTALKAINELDTVVRYSLLMNENDGLSFENVIFKEKNEETSAYILRYEPDLDWLTENNFEFIESSYTGMLYVKNLNQTIMAVVNFTNGIGQLTDDSPTTSGRTDCDGNGSGGGSSGGGGGSGGGTGGGSGSGGSGGSSGSGGGCEWGTSSATGGMWIDCPVIGLIFVARTACDGVGEVPSDLDGDEGDNGNGPIGILPKLALKALLIARIDAENDPEAKRKLQLKYINDWGGVEGKEFKALIEEELLATRGLTVGDVTDINESVNTYYLNLRGQYIYAIFLPVAELSKPFIELALFETGTGVLFQAVKGILSVRWSFLLTKTGINSVSFTTLTNRLKSALSFELNNTYLTLKIGGRNMTGSAVGTTSSSKVAYKFNGVTANEAKAIFNDMTSGRQAKRVDLGGGKYVESVSWGTSPNKQSLAFRNFSKTGQIGDPVIDISMPAIRTGKVELKFFP